MGEWSKKPIGEAVTLQRGIDITRAEQRQGSVPVVSSSGIASYHDTAAVKGPGVVLGRKGVVGSVFFVEQDYWPHDTSLWVKDFHGNDPRFVYYFFRSMCDVLKNLDVGSANPTLNRNHVHPILVSWPSSVHEQSAISEVLAALDDKIELNRQMNATLERQARALFRDWFVDFGPVKAKMARAKQSGGLPSTGAYLAPNLWNLFPATLDPEGKPEGWRSFSVGELATQNTASINPFSSPDQLFEHYSLPAYDSGQSPAIDLGETIKSNKTIVPECAVLLSKLNPEISRVWLPDPKGQLQQVASTEFLAFVAEPWVGRNFLYYLFADPTFRQTLEGMVTGTSKSHQRISPPALRAMQAVIADPAIIGAFNMAVAPMVEQLTANRLQSRTLAQTRDLLLPKLMSGEIRVRDAEKFVELVP